MSRRARQVGAALAVAVASCLAPLHAALAGGLQLDPHGLDPGGQLAAQAVLDAAAARLPAALVAGGEPVTVRWVDDLPPHVQGRARGRAVVLRRGLLGAAGTAPAPALSALVHELAHVHDRSAAGGLSRDPRLLDLAGWQLRPLRLGLRSTRNAFTDRSPDLYELDSPAEFVAVNLEHFVLDPGYRCRRPQLHAYFAERLHWAPPAAAQCDPGFAFVDAGEDGAADTLLRVDPARVHAVDYLLAEGNERPMSHWGHAMLRLVVCAPGRAPGPGCRLDLQHHRVLSFRAHVDDVQVSSWRGLTGAYPSRLYVLPLDQVVEEYTKVELRGLRSIPLRLDADGIAGLLARAAQVHWSYDGRYYFVSNNCAVETFKLLHDGVPSLAGARLSSITPAGLLRRLERAGIADQTVFDDRARAVRLGYRFEPASAHYEAMYAVASSSLGLPQADARAWMALPPARRAPWLAGADLRAAAALLLLEEAALRRQEVLARDELKRTFFDDGRVAKAGVAAGLDALLREGAVLARPAALLAESGYGLPQAEELARLDREAGTRGARLHALRDALRMQGRSWLSPLRRTAIEGGQANIGALAARLRHLHEDAGGARIAQPAPVSAR